MVVVKAFLATVLLALVVGNQSSTCHEEDTGLMQGAIPVYDSNSNVQTQGGEQHGKEEDTLMQEVARHRGGREIARSERRGEADDDVNENKKVGSGSGGAPVPPVAAPSLTLPTISPVKRASLAMDRAAKVAGESFDLQAPLPGSFVKPATETEAIKIQEAHDTQLLVHAHATERLVQKVGVSLAGPPREGESENGVARRIMARTLAMDQAKLAGAIQGLAHSMGNRDAKTDKKALDAGAKTAA